MRGSRYRGPVFVAFWVLALTPVSCRDIPTLEGTRCKEPEVPCGDELGCVGGICLSLRGAPILCESHADCAEADPRRSYCVGLENDVPGNGESYRDNFCAGCGSDADCEDSVCVKGEANWFCIGCLDDTHCDTGRCAGNVCRSCKSDNQCKSGTCQDGRCVHEEGGRP